MTRDPDIVTLSRPGLRYTVLFVPQVTCSCEVIHNHLIKTEH